MGSSNPQSKRQIFYARHSPSNSSLVLATYVQSRIWKTSLAPQFQFSAVDPRRINLQLIECILPIFFLKLAQWFTPQFQSAQPIYLHASYIIRFPFAPQFSSALKLYLQASCIPWTTFAQLFQPGTDNPSTDILHSRIRTTIDVWNWWPQYKQFKFCTDDQFAGILQHYMDCIRSQLPVWHRSIHKHREGFHHLHNYF